MAESSGSPALVGIDWGSSKLRVALIGGDGRLLDRRESAAGIFSVRDRDFASALWPLCADWLARHRVPLLACGMIGSRQGIVEVPYLPCPADLAGLASALGRVELPPVHGAAAGAATLFIVPGMVTGSAQEGWDVMRGEETQLLGIAADEGRLFVLPGTHSKWLRRGADGRLESFQTYMTGELFELLCSHGSLSRVMAPPTWSPQAFDAGVCEARDGALEDLLFRVRTAALMGALQAAELADYLSGLLIGAELKAGLHRFAAAASKAPITVLGGAPLTQRYAIAMALFGIGVRELPGDAVFAGLMSIARAASLLGGRGAPANSTRDPCV